VGALDVGRKGQDLALEALSARPWRNRDWQLSIFGAGENRKYLEDLIRFYGLAGRVELAGEVLDVRSIWRAHHALLVPSRIESAPLVVVEAMLCGRPVIANDVGGIREWVRDGRDGFLSPAATAESFGAALERAWERRHEWPQMGAHAHESALSMYDPAPAETLLEIIASAARRDRQRPAREELAKAAAR
jgi:glycosyltransferase involved in cell wall biosynthesis